MNKLLTSPRTSVAAILGFVALVASQLKASFDGDPTTVTDWNVVVNAVTILFVGLFARDNGTTSEEAHAK